MTGESGMQEGTDGKEAGRLAGAVASGASNQELALAVQNALIDRDWTLAVAESCTGGLVMKALTDIPGSSRYFVGGVVSYADRAKSGILDVSPATLDTFGAVSGETAGEMAQGVARLLGTGVGLAVTGIAGPDGAVPGKPVGTVWFGLVLPEGGTWEERLRFRGGREEVREAAMRHALHLLFRGATDAPAEEQG